MCVPRVTELFARVVAIETLPKLVTVPDPLIGPVRAIAKSLTSKSIASPSSLYVTAIPF